MSDDLSRLTPTDPSNIDPNWSDKRASILDDVLADGSRSNRSIRRWVAGVAATAVILVGAGVVVQQLRPEPSAIPASPSAFVSPIPLGQLVAADDTLIDTGNGIALCNGTTEEGLPPACPDVTPVVGITWDDLDWEASTHGTTWAPVVLVGTFDGETFSASDVYSPHDPEAPARPDTDADADADADAEETYDEPLCSDPVQGYGTTTSEEALYTIVESLPGFQRMWPSADYDFQNIAVTEDVTRAREILEVSWSGLFCVGSLAGPTAAEMEASDEALWKMTEDGRLLRFFPGAVSDGTHLLMATAFQATPELVSELEQIVGPDVWAYTEVDSFYYPVLPTPDPDPVPPTDNDQLIAAQDTLIDTGTGMALCNGSILESRPPGCPFPTPVTGITWADVPWAERADGITFDRTPGSITFADAIIVGTFDGDDFVGHASLPRGRSRGPPTSGNHHGRGPPHAVRCSHPWHRS